MICSICPRRCGAERTETEGHGSCRMPAAPVVARAALHPWEEPVLCGNRGAGTVFFSGCNLGCVYCQNHAISRGNFGRPVTSARLREIFLDLIAQGAATIDLVTPTHFVPLILPALDPPLPVPVVYNCGGYESVETLRLLEGKVQVYLPDLKYADAELARRLSAAPDYPEVAAAAIEEMYRQVGPAQIEDDVMQRGMIVRHLVLPGYVDNSLGVLDWFSEHFHGKGVWFSLMSQYVPMGRAKNMPPFDRHITENEYAAACSYLKLCDIENGYTQDFSSAIQDYIPKFDLSGL